LVVIPKDSGGMQGNWFVGSGMEGLLFHNQWTAILQTKLQMQWARPHLGSSTLPSVPRPIKGIWYSW
jgi:hypothetical protein